MAYCFTVWILRHTHTVDSSANYKTVIDSLILTIPGFIIYNFSCSSGIKNNIQQYYFYFPILIKYLKLQWFMQCPSDVTTALLSVSPTIIYFGEQGATLYCFTLSFSSCVK